MPRLEIPIKLWPFMTKPKRFKIALGGRGGTKSQTYADILSSKVAKQRLKVGCFREFQNSIDDSVYALLVSEISRLGLSGFKAVGNRIHHKKGGEFRFKGLSRNPESVQSMHGFNIFWLEEAQTTSANSLKLITPTLRTPGSEIWLSLNPMSSSDPVSKRFIEPFIDQLMTTGVYEDDLHLIVFINYYDNPWFPEELEMERQYDYDSMPRALYNHVWLGHYNDTVEHAIIEAEWFDAAIDAHLRLGFSPRGIKVCAFDPADSGDAKAMSIRHGSVLTHCEKTDSGDVNEACDWALNRAIEEQVDLFTWDCDGIGLPLQRQIKQSLSGKRISWEMFKGSNAVDRPGELYCVPGFKMDAKRQRTNRETFKNKRAQYYWGLRDRLFNTYQAVTKGKWTDPEMMLSISSKIPQLQHLRSELCRIPRKFNSNGLIQILSKPEMRLMKIKSPNMSDSCMMSLISSDLQGNTESDNMEYSSLW